MIDNLVQKTSDYYDYINEHRENIQKAWVEIKNKCYDHHFLSIENFSDLMDERILNHDLSKYSSDEFHAYRRNFYPCEGESKNPEEFDKAWEHHWKNNDHHWQYWMDKKNASDSLMQMLAYTEMICDWVAMSYKFGETALSYYEKLKTQIYIAPNYIIFIENVLKSIYSEVN